jgi:hypothetical protein
MLLYRSPPAERPRLTPSVRPSSRQLFILMLSAYLLIMLYALLTTYLAYLISCARALAAGHPARGSCARPCSAR